MNGTFEHSISILIKFHSLVFIVGLFVLLVSSFPLVYSRTPKIFKLIPCWKLVGGS